MPADLENRLSRLAPEVDLDDAREGWRARVHRRARRRRIALGAGAAVVAAAVVAGAVAVAGDDEGESVTAGPGETVDGGSQTVTATESGCD